MTLVNTVSVIKWDREARTDNYTHFFKDIGSEETGRERKGREQREGKGREGRGQQVEKVWSQRAALHSTGHLGH